jgi:ribonuclease G
MNINTLELCPSCGGTGKVSSTLLLEDEIEKRINYLITHAHKELTLMVHPILYAYLTKGWLFSIVRKWKRKHKVNLTLKSNNNYHLIEYHFYDSDDEEIKF